MLEGINNKHGCLCLEILYSFDDYVFARLPVVSPIGNQDVTMQQQRVAKREGLLGRSSIFLRAGDVVAACTSTLARLLYFGIPPHQPAGAASRLTHALSESILPTTLCWILASLLTHDMAYTLAALSLARLYCGTQLRTHSCTASTVHTLACRLNYPGSLPDGFKSGFGLGMAHEMGPSDRGRLGVHAGGRT